MSCIAPLPCTTRLPQSQLLEAESQALTFLLPLSKDYPGIERWFINKVVPGLREGTRLLLPIERGHELVGLGIAKNEKNERKICTVRVSPGYASRGIGVRLFDGLLKWLDDDRPYLTVNGTKLPLFERLFDYYGFNVTSAKEGRYVPNLVEFGFNEKLPVYSGPTELLSGQVMHSM